MSHKRYRLPLQYNSLQDLKKELKRRSHYIVYVGIGALAMVSTRLRKWLQVLDVAKELELLRRVCLLGTARILRKVVDMG